ncbi:hypothetical protein KQI52_00805 [bacterium]|nr:hypothetical protein [bacterium]
MRHRSRAIIIPILTVLVLTIAAEGATMLPDDAPRYTESYLDSLAVDLAAGSDRPYLFSGTGTSFYYGTTATVASDGWMGLHVGDHKLLDDWILVIDGVPKDRAKAQVRVKPHEVIFRWRNGITLRVSPVGVDRDDLRFNCSMNGEPFVPGSGEGESEDTQVGLFFVFPSSLTIEKAHQNKTRGIQYYLGIAGTDSVFMAAGSKRWFDAPEMRTVNRDAKGPFATHIGKAIHGAMFNEPGFDLTFTWGESAELAGDRWVEIRRSEYSQQQDRRNWLLDELNRSYFHCDDERINRAVNWAKLSMAGLFAEDNSLIWAGLPWFNEGWARDTFISLPGAALVLGKFDAAEQIFRRFAQWQNTDMSSADYGKVPNRARGEDIIYNTADGTPWFVRELYEYGLYSGDRTLWTELGQPGGVIEKSVQGAMTHRVDEQGLLTHGDADTWMDAKGVDGAWSPRGNRAVEIQALWLAQLQAAEWMLSYAGHKVNYQPQRDQLIASFRKHFIREDGLGLVDHLNEDGTPDLKIRPNQAWAVTVPLSSENSLVTVDERAAIVNTMRDSLVYRWGVASLAQTDEDFHPYHETIHYPKDAAYHMGIVWTWLSGPYKSASRHGVAVARDEVHQILDRGCVGTLSENLDALPRHGSAEPNTSGTVSQAWSLAEFLRALYQDYLGVKPVYDDPGAWEFDPRYPRELGEVDAIVWMNGQPVRLASSFDDQTIRFTFTALTPDSLAEPIRIKPFRSILDTMDTISDPNGELSRDVPRWTLVLDRKNDGTELRINAGPMLPAFQSVPIPLLISAEDDEPLLQPRTVEGITSLQPPDYPLIPNETIKAWSEKAPVIVDAADPEHDDTGVVEGKTYGYPTNPAFLPGILDLTHVTVRADHDLAYFSLTFRDLSDPGWRPEYGFQLTFATIAIRSGNLGGPLRTDVRRNSNYVLPGDYAADRFIHVGGGIEIEDADGEIIAAHIPNDPAYRLGDTKAKTVSFAIPLDYLGTHPEHWKIAVLVGAQDDHGGGGIGEFRAVTPEGGRWAGSGADESDPNVYDVLFVE